jgi:hypothetical protein
VRQVQFIISRSLKLKLCCTGALKMLQVPVLEGWKLHATALLISQTVANVLLLLLSMWQDSREWPITKSTEASQTNARRRDDQKQPVLSLKGAASVRFTAEHGRSITPRSRAQSWSSGQNHALHNTDTDHEITNERCRARGRSSVRGPPLIKLDTGGCHSLSWLTKHSRPVEPRDLLNAATPGLRYLLSGPEMDQNVGSGTEDATPTASPLPSPKWYDLNDGDGDYAWSLVPMDVESATSLLGTLP